MLELKKTLLLATSASGNGDLTGKLIRDYVRELFPEMGDDQESFEKRGLGVLKEFAGKAFVLESDAQGGLSATTVEEKDLPSLREIEQQQQEQVEKEIKARWKKKFGVEPKIRY